jgi:hypothetical protein
VKQISSVSKETATALRDAVKTHFDITPGTKVSGEITFAITFDMKRGEPYTKTVPQASCPWTLLSVALHLAGFGRNRITEIVTTVQEMTDAERKEYRDSMSDSVKEVMEGIGATTVRTVAGTQTFDTFTVQVT